MLFIGAATVVAVGAFVACGGGQSTTGGATTPTSTAPPTDTAAAATTTAPASTPTDTSAAATTTATSTTPPANCATQMFGKYGQEAFLKVNASIVQKAAAAPVDKVGSSFSKLTPAQVATLKTNLAAFLVKVYGGPDGYKGKSMEEAHKGLKITSDQYDYFIANVVVPALADNGVSQDDITKCFAAPVTDPSFKASIVGK
jgi:hypothetical protein